MVDFRLFLLVLAFTAFFVIITCVLNHFIKENKFIKYSPGILSLVASLYNFYLASKASQGLENLGRFLMGALFLIGFLSVLFSGLYIDIVMPKIRKNR
jgi:hypothetical protein